MTLALHGRHHVGNALSVAAVALEVGMRLEEVATALSHAPVSYTHLDVYKRQVTATGVSLDSRTVLPGDLYAALPGQHAHGADFAAASLTAGAVAVLTDLEGQRRLDASGALGGTVPLLVVTDPRRVLGEIAALVYDHPADALQLIGITGTNGKTTTAYLVESALRAAGRQTGLIGTVETRAGTTVLRSVRCLLYTSRCV